MMVMMNGEEDNWVVIKITAMIRLILTINNAYAIDDNDNSSEN